MSIDTYLSELKDAAAPLKNGRLVNLSALSDEERTAFAAAWPSLPLDRRRTVLQRLTDLAEDNPELDFDAVFLTALDDADAVVRRMAVEGLWEHDERDVIEPLVRLLRYDPEDAVRAVAALLLGRFVLLGEYGDLRPRDAVTVTDALRATVEDPIESGEVRARALEALGACSQPWTRDLIEDAYASDDDRMMVSALHAMGRSADSYWLPTLLKELDNRDPQLRYEAAAALGEVEDEAAVPALAEHLSDDDPEVQEAVIYSLGQIGGDEALAILRRYQHDADARVQDAVQAALDEAQFGDDPLGLRL